MGARIEWLVRLGYVARAILYITIGVIALSGFRAIRRGTDEVFQSIENFPMGYAGLWLMAAGLCGYALLRMSSFVFDIEHRGSDAKGWMTRIGHGGSAIGHLVLAWTATQFARGNGAPNSDGAQDAAAGVLSIPFGGWLIGSFGVVFFAAAAVQAKKAYSGSFMDRIVRDAPAFTRHLGAVGYAARTVVYLMIGWSLVRAGFFAGHADEVRSLGTAIIDLAENGEVFILTAVGLIVFGVFSLILARYRIIPDLKPS